MIGQLRGRLAEKRPNQGLVDVGGVGYLVQVPLSTYAATSTWFGLFSASRPRSWPIIARQYCRFSFARQREAGLAYTHAKKGPPRGRAYPSLDSSGMRVSISVDT